VLTIAPEDSDTAQITDVDLIQLMGSPPSAAGVEVMVKMLAKAEMREAILCQDPGPRLRPGCLPKNWLIDLRFVERACMRLKVGFLSFATRYDLTRTLAIYISAPIRV
jgi:hypothetical protein